MNATGSETEATLLDLVSFKWLMAGRGWRVDLSRLREDAPYAKACVQRGLDSGLELLRQRSVELQPLLPQAEMMFALSNNVLTDLTDETGTACRRYVGA